MEENIFWHLNANAFKFNSATDQNQTTQRRDRTRSPDKTTVSRPTEDTALREMQRKALAYSLIRNSGG